MEMAKGIPVTRNQNLMAITAEAKRVLLQTKNWERTKDHTYFWIKAKYGLSRTTVTDYIDDVYARLTKDPETRSLLS